MQWQAASLFATPVFKLSMDHADRAKDFFDNHIRHQTDKDVFDQQGKLSHYHSQKNVFDVFKELSWLKEQLEEGGNLVYQELLNHKKSGPMKITNAWFNLCQPGGSQPAHNHVNCLLCGTFYLHTDKETKIMFHHPQKNASHHPELFDAPTNDRNEHGLRFHMQESKVDVNTGECLYWPSQLKHGYSENNTPDRLSLSFNLMPEKLNFDYQVNVGS